MLEVNRLRVLIVMTYDFFCSYIVKIWDIFLSFFVLEMNLLVRSRICLFVKVLKGLVSVFSLRINFGEGILWVYEVFVFRE